MLRGITHALAYRIRHRPFRAALLAASFTLGAFASASCNGAGQTPATSRSYQPVQQQIQQRAQQPAHPGGAASASAPISEIRANIGFRSRNQFDEHFVKHGAEFGQITKQEYLRQAQTLRDDLAQSGIT